MPKITKRDIGFLTTGAALPLMLGLLNQNVELWLYLLLTLVMLFIIANKFKP